MQPTSALDGLYTLQDEMHEQRPVYKNFVKKPNPAKTDMCGILQWLREPGKVGWHLTKCYPTKNYVERSKYFAKRYLR